MHDIFREDKTMLLSFEILPSDKAYVVERAHVEKVLYQPKESVTRKMFNKAFNDYWNSRVPVYSYKGKYIIPQLSIWSPIEVERLEMEWVKSSDDLWKKVKENNW